MEEDAPRKSQRLLNKKVSYPFLMIEEIKGKRGKSPPGHRDAPPAKKPKRYSDDTGHYPVDFRRVSVLKKIDVEDNDNKLLLITPVMY